ncbi:MAG: hypothetical protein LKE89_08930 [Lactobacillaceae bacterium]|jgi:hypothetical protein|nr:hypothetical protein [Lactobacillaceae bacterium]
MLEIKIIDQNGTIKQGKNDYEEQLRPLVFSGVEYAYLATQVFSFAEGDQIVVAVDRPGYYWLKLDEALDNTLVYIKETVHYQVTLTANAGDARPETAFHGQRHYLAVRRATKAQIDTQQNLSLNPHDQKNFNGSYPHASANVETRNDATFFACNAINGILANQMHGEYPYQSWGINRQADAALTIDFGREVQLTGVGIVLRGDYPHDSYWTEGTLTFSDGSTEILHFEKRLELQQFKFTPRNVDKVTFSQLQKADDDSPFPALTEIECYGYNLKD